MGEHNHLYAQIVELHSCVNLNWLTMNVNMAVYLNLVLLVAKSSYKGVRYWFMLEIVA